MSLTSIRLVALREFIENVRTKGFWISILLVPVMIAGSVVVPALLAKTKDVRTYAVLDRSGWLLGEIESRARLEDARDLLEIVRDADRKGSLAGIPSLLAGLAPAVRGTNDAQLGALALALSGTEALVAEEAGAAPAAEALAACRAGAADYRAWYDGLSPVVARSIDRDLARSRFERVRAEARSEEELRAALEAGPKSLFAYFVIGEDPVAGSGGCKYVSNNSTDNEVRSWLARLATDSVRRERFAREGVDPTVASRIQEPLRFEDTQVGKGGEKAVSVEDRIRQAAPAVFTYLLWFTTFMSAQSLLTNTIEEKSNRLMEVLLSSVSPVELMTGKTLGTALTGLTIVMSWVGLGIGAIALVPRMLGMDLGIDAGQIITGSYLVSFVGYYLLGYLLYSSIFCAIGSLCDSLKDAQNLIQPVMLVLIMPLFALIFVTQDPNGTLARVLSFIPPFTPFVMMNRAAGPPAAWEYAATLVLLAASVMFAFYFSAKIFRIGVLMTGQPPRPAEILRLMRAPVGSAAPAPRDPAPHRRD